MGYEIRQNLTNVNYTSRGTNPSWIVIHNTSNGTSAEGIAYNNTQYFKNVNRSASAHFFVDDGNVIWQCVRETDSAWHCGDQPSRNGCYNSNSIGIEVCETADTSFSEHEIQVLCWLVPMLMRKYGIPASRVCRHHDVTGKICPAGYIDDGRWAQLKARITNGQGGSEEEPEVITDQDLDRIADRVWNKHYNGASMGGKLAGADSAANWTKSAIENHQVAADAALAVWSFQQNGKQMRDVVWDASWWVLHFVENEVPTIIKLATAIAQRVGANGGGQSISSN